MGRDASTGDPTNMASRGALLLPGPAGVPCAPIPLDGTHSAHRVYSRCPLANTGGSGGPW